MPIQPKQQPPYYDPTPGIIPTGETKQYIALITQSGTNAPTAIIIKNTLGTTPTWQYDAVGVYKTTLTGQFKNNKTYPSISQNNDATKNFLIYNSDEDDVWIETGGDSLMNKTPITITIYP